MPDLDGSFVEDIINHLFEDDQKKDGGLDLTALNIQRGRDHGIPGYNKYREHCTSYATNFGKVNSFVDLTTNDWISQSHAIKLEKVYANVDDIDLFVGGMLEKKHEDGLLGPTFKCIIGEQFKKLKQGDRFWYENGSDPKTRFSEEQLQEIRKTTLARLLCDNSKIKFVQPRMFKIPMDGNPLVKCEIIPGINLDLFKE